MNKKFAVLALAVVVVSSAALCGCKGKVEKSAEEQPNVEMSTTDNLPQPGAMLASQVPQPVVEPAQTVASETIPPTASAAQAVQKTAAAAVTASAHDRNKDMQTALKNAGFYTGTIDGKIGPRTKKAVEEFQRAKGLKVDGKVGQKTWAELEKYLLRQ